MLLCSIFITYGAGGNKEVQGDVSLSTALLFDARGRESTAREGAAISGATNVQVWNALLGCRARLGNTPWRGVTAAP